MQSEHRVVEKKTLRKSEGQEIGVMVIRRKSLTLKDLLQTVKYCLASEILRINS